MMINEKVFQPLLFLALSLIVLITMTSGCTSSRTVTKETSTTSEDTSPGTTVVVKDNTADATDTSTKTVTTTETTEPEHHSLVGSVFNFVGDVIAFPFRLIGGVFDAVF